MVTENLKCQKDEACTVTEASLNVLHGVLSAVPVGGRAASARLTSDSGQALMSQEETGAQEES